jgi:hypothetical protein
MRVLSVIFSLLILFSCARQGTPTGGPKDETPPRFLGSKPDTLSVNVPTDLTEIKIEFDEYIILKEHTKNIVVSPPLASSASYMPVGSPSKTLKIKFTEPLQPNTTYNINFGNAIQDNNEGNKLPYFSYVFSTGDFIDSLTVKGKANIPSQKKPSENLLVALFKVDENFKDSLVIKSKPFYIAKVNTDGNFNLNYLSPGKYQMIAFDDVVQNTQFDIGKEKFGYLDELIDLSENQEFNIQLFDQLAPYKVGKAEQKGYGHLLFRLEGQPEKVEIEPLDMNFTTSEISYVPKSDSLNFWFKPSIDSIAENSKRLRFAVKHENQVDTISVVYSNAVKHKLTIDRKTKLDYAPTRNIPLRTNYPIMEMDSSKVIVWKDSIQIPSRLIADPTTKNLVSIKFPIELNSKYEVNILPDALKDYFGETNDSIKFDFKTKSKNEYGNLRLTLQNKPNHPFWLQMYNEKDELVDEKYTTLSYFEYNYLPSAKFYFKLLVDENENGHWDTGNFFERKQPEASYVYPTDIQTRLMWDIEETWVIPSVPTGIEKEKSPSETGEDLP